jgi:hypothetical protein
MVLVRERCGSKIVDGWGRYGVRIHPRSFAFGAEGWRRGSRIGLFGHVGELGADAKEADGAAGGELR